ncbi:SusD/RagB family nutrient-binding outer membrane lipoprotein [Hymenobacter aquaticus]|uniref:SusD/RagB family nutrient-binding outer membrane lipoprotein n=1 Tax=Hymenobacter aquaticus TaxID=1867101 RepID=A0A4Z0PY91_9BACT|nr:SusD/RagB family nutrient-binding outer membrane lipoprotein [Hymenobacter aquaticus]TGE22284.1 SusD/RagB family nutrient-binding outer membrane lipoprotein [Hymenobacter aquaticus]
MLSKYNKIALMLPLALGLGACEKGFEEFNTNPNQPLTVSPDALLTGAETATAFRLFDVPANMDGGLLIAQHWAKSQYTTEDRYSFRSTSYQSIWDGFYTGTAALPGGLKDFNELLRIGKESNNPNMQAVALVMRSYYFSVLTDIFGDIPYSDALKLSTTVNVITPKYDKQEDVYKGLLADLKQATTLLKQKSTMAVGGDVMFGGNMTKWEKFSNSLRLRLAMRAIDANEGLAKPEIADVLNGSNLLMTSNADNAQVVFLSAQPNTNPVFENRLTRDDHRVSQSITSVLSRRKDPRLPIYANPAECAAKPDDKSVPDSTGLYRGIKNGLTNPVAQRGPLCSMSKVGDYFTKADAPGVLMTWSEVLFFTAEARARGIVTGDAEAAYNSAIRASMAQYGITDVAAVDAYIAQPLVKYNKTSLETQKASIGTQKWIALYGQGVEAWSELRRLDYPFLSLPASPVGAAGGKLPVRFRYPSNEQSLNQANYTAAVARQGADLIRTRLWWDVKN